MKKSLRKMLGHGISYGILKSSLMDYSAD